MVQKFIYSNADVLSTAELFPYYINIEFPVYEDGTNFRELVRSNKASQPLMAALVKTFNESNFRYTPSTFATATNRSYYSGDISNSSIEYVEEAFSGNTTSYDFLEFLTSETELQRDSDYNFIDENSFQYSSNCDGVSIGEFSIPISNLELGSYILFVEIWNMCLLKIGHLKIWKFENWKMIGQFGNCIIHIA